MSGESPVKMAESSVIHLWQNQVATQTRLKDITGMPLTVIYPGRPNDCRGGDFQDALIQSEKGLQKGRIEVHTLTSGWQSHGHHLDPHYNQVILQVAWKVDRGVPARSADGRLIPTVVIQSPPGDNGGISGGEETKRRESAQCRGNKIKRGRLEKILEEAGEERFSAHSRIFQEALQEGQPPDELLYRRAARALGYSHNQDSVYELACRMPLSACRAILPPAKNPEYPDYQSFVLGQAGLLPFQRRTPPETDEFSAQLETIWKSHGWSALSPPPAWEFFRIRPANSPVRRLIALSGWLAGGCISDWRLHFLKPLIDQPETVRQVWRTVLKVASPAYWQRHFDFGRPSAAALPGLLGDSRCDDLIINVILPFLSAWATENRKAEISFQVREEYRRHAALAVNSIERHMLHQLAAPEDISRSARRQQGLLHLYRTYCIEGRCPECPCTN